MPRGQGKRKATETGRKDPNPRTAKKQKIDDKENLFDTLSDEIIQNIFISTDYSELARFCSLCRRFNAVTKLQNFWKSMAIATFGPNVVPLKVINTQGVVEFDPTEYLLPTFSDGNNKHIDWKRYFKLRHTIQNMFRALNDHYAIEKRHEDYIRGIYDSWHTESSAEEAAAKKLAAQNEPKSDNSNSEDEMSDEEHEEKSNEKEQSEGEESDSEDQEVENEDDLDDDDSRSGHYYGLDENDVDAYTTSIMHLLNDVSQEEYIFNRPRRLLRITTAFVIELLPLFIEYGMHKRVKQCAWLMYSNNKGTYFTYAKAEIFIYRAFTVYELVKYQPRLRDKMLKQICQLWTPFYKQTKDRDEVYAMFKRIVNEIIESFKFVEEYDWEQSHESDFGDEDYKPAEWIIVPQNYPEQSESEEDLEEKENIPCDIMRFPQRGKLHPRKTRLVHCLIDTDDPFELSDPLLDLIVQYYFEDTEDLDRKAFALELTDIIRRLSDDHVDDLISMAIEAEASGHDRLVFNAYVILARVIVTDELADLIDEKQKLEVFDILNRGIATKPRSGLYFIGAIVELLKGINVAEFIDDERFDQMNKNILDLLSQHRKIFNKYTHQPRGWKLWEEFGQLGATFGTRMQKYLPLYEDAIVKLAASKVKRYRPYTNEKKIPLITKPQILYQYALLGKYAIGEEFEPTIERLVEKVMDKSIGFDVDMPEFQALFGEACYKVMKKDPKKLEQMIDDLLKVIPADIHSFGQSEIMEQQQYDMTYAWYTSRWPKYVPLTLEEYKTAVAAYRKFEKPTTNQTDEIFTFKNPEPRKVEYDLEKNIGSGYRGMKKTAVKYMQYHPDIVQFNPTSDTEWEYSYEELIQLAHEETNLQAAKRLIEIFNQDNENFSIKHTQQTLRVLFGFLRCKCFDLSLYQAVTDLYEKLAPLLSEEDKERYIEVISIICLRASDQLGFRFKNEKFQAMLYKFHSLVVDFIECSKETLTNLMEHSLDVALNFSTTEFAKKKNLQIVYNLVKRFLKYSPRKTFQAVTHSAVRKILDKYDDEPEYLCAIAALGYHFGVDFVEHAAGSWGLSIKVDLTDLNEALFKWNKSRRKKTQEQIADVENFIVLLSACSINEELKHLCVYNSVLFDSKMFLSAIKNDKFDTKIKSLNERVKKWTSMKDMFDIDSL